MQELFAAPVIRRGCHQPRQGNPTCPARNQDELYIYEPTLSIELMDMVQTDRALVLSAYYELYWMELASPWPKWLNLPIPGNNVIGESTEELDMKVEKVELKFTWIDRGDRLMVYAPTRWTCDMVYDQMLYLLTVNIY